MLSVNFFLVYQLKGAFSTGAKPSSVKFRSQDSTGNTYTFLRKLMALPFLSREHKPLAFNKLKDTTQGRLQTVVRYEEKMLDFQSSLPNRQLVCLSSSHPDKQRHWGVQQWPQHQAVIGNPPFYLLCLYKLSWFSRAILSGTSASGPATFKAVYFPCGISTHSTASTLLRRCAFVYGPTAATGSP